jgi:hypothetical protein
MQFVSRNPTPLPAIAERQLSTLLGHSERQLSGEKPTAAIGAERSFAGHLANGNNGSLAHAIELLLWVGTPRWCHARSGRKRAGWQVAADSAAPTKGVGAFSG